MVAAASKSGMLGPLGLVVNGEAGEYVEALSLIVGPRLLETYPARSDEDVLDLVQSGQADAVVLDEAATDVEPLHLLRMIHRLDEGMLVVIVTGRSDRRLLEDALRLAAFSVLRKPLRLEALLFQIHRMMVRLDETLRRDEF